MGDEPLMLLVDSTLMHSDSIIRKRVDLPQAYFKLPAHN